MKSWIVFYFILDYVKKFGENFASCQAGISSFYTEVIVQKIDAMDVFI